MLTGILAGLAAGALWGVVFVAPRMVPGFSSVDLSAGRFLAYGAVAAIVMLIGMRTRRVPTMAQALAAVALSVLGFTGYYLLLVLAIRNAGTGVPHAHHRHHTAVGHAAGQAAAFTLGCAGPGPGADGRGPGPHDGRAPWRRSWRSHRALLARHCAGGGVHGVLDGLCDPQLRLAQAQPR